MGYPSRPGLGLGDACRVLGQFAEAAEAFQKALAIDPHATAALYKLTTVQRGADDAEIDRLRRLSTDPDTGAEVRRMTAMALAQLFDDAGRYDEAFAAAVEGNRLARAAQEAKNVRYDHEALCASVDALMRVFTPEFFAATRDWGDPSELPVFVVGHFRTGSTLVEQICASHSQVQAVGESNEIPQIATVIRRTEPRTDHWAPRLFREFADRHLKNLAAGAQGKRRVVDKLLDNIFHLGLIAVMFPRARVIFTHRDGRDVALSVFLRQFAEKVGFATDLVDAGRHWRESERMAAYWARCLPLPMHHVQYETLIDDFESEARKLIDFLGLLWEPACFEFHKTERAVRTESLWQVRQPLYNRSVGRWRHYARHLRQLCEVIGLDPNAPTGAPGRDRSKLRPSPSASA
jgi:tetratricopeptide (TPR) repeat protein